jgi:hypothetical protein
MRPKIDGHKATLSTICRQCRKISRRTADGLFDASRAVDGDHAVRGLHAEGQEGRAGLEDAQVFADGAGAGGGEGQLVPAWAAGGRADARQVGGGG